METGFKVFIHHQHFITNGNLAGWKLQTFKSQKETMTKFKDGHDANNVEKEKVQI